MHDPPHRWHGRLLDPDSHLLLPAPAYVELLGPRLGRPLARWAEKFLRAEHADAPPAHPDPAVAVWRRSNWQGVGAERAAERVEALALMGIERQLVLPPVCWPALHDTTPDAAPLLRRYNDHVLEWAGEHADRLRPVALLPAHDVAGAVAEAEHALGRGARAFEWPFAHPPAGLSPADPAWDPLWAILSTARAPLVLHVGGGGIGDMGGPARSMLDLRWGRTTELRPPLPAGEVHPYGAPERGDVGPFDVATQHVPAEVFLSALVLGGVFDRHPGLAVAVLELGAQWVGGWVERLDSAWDGSAGLFRWKRAGLERRPSEIVRAHVRVAPAYGESIGTSLERHELPEVFVFSSDHPHAEGGVDPVEFFARSLRPLGTEVTERFFVDNARILFPP